MKGYKIGIDPDTLELVLIELEVPEEYPGRMIYEHEVKIFDPVWGDASTHPRIVKQYRANVARVLKIQKTATVINAFVGSAFSLHDTHFYYRLGEIVYPDNFDPDPDVVCTNGIHFFGTVKDAVEYTEDGWVRYIRSFILDSI